jgi:hypothetical protein
MVSALELQCNLARRGWEWREIRNTRGRKGENGGAVWKVWPVSPPAAANRPRAIANLNELLKGSPNCLMLMLDPDDSPRLPRESRTFVRREDGSPRAAVGTHDDCVMAMAIAESVRMECGDTGGQAGDKHGQRPEPATNWVANGNVRGAESGRFRPFAEQVLEDVVSVALGPAEIVVAGDEQKPVTLWPVDRATIRMKSDWDAQLESAR